MLFAADPHPGKKFVCHAGGSRKGRNDKILPDHDGAGSFWPGAWAELRKASPFWDGSRAARVIMGVSAVCYLLMLRKVKMELEEVYL